MGGGGGVRRLSLAMAGALLVTQPTVAVADPTAFKDDDGITAGASTPGYSKPGVSRRPSAITCSYHDPYAPKIPGTGTTFPREVIPAEGGTFVRICKRPDGTEVSNKIVVIPPREPSGEVLARDALSHEPLPTPQPRTSPPNAKTYVNFETWLAVDDWSPVEASASVPGLTTTVMAEPTEATWKMGDGQTVVCKGPGKPYDLSLPEGAQRTDCSHIYRRSSAGMGPDNTYPASVTVTYRVTWSASDGSGGELGDLPVTTNFRMRVREIQVVNVYPRDP